MGKFIVFNYGSYGFIIIAAIVSMLSQAYIQSNYQKYSNVNTLKGLTGAQIARHILDSKGLFDVQVVQSNRGTLSDHYDPTKRIVALSPKVYNDSSIASVSVAAHEVGHAIQHAEEYVFLAVRNRMLPAVMISSKLSMFPIMLGFFAENTVLFNIGILMLGVMALFQIVTLPLEFDASKRAVQILDSEQILVGSELAGSKKMLTAAALTYVAALFSTLMTILRYIAINNRNRRND